MKAPTSTAHPLPAAKLYHSVHNIQFITRPIEMKHMFIVELIIYLFCLNSKFAYFFSFSFVHCSFYSSEYPCDHYTSVINVTLLMSGCPRVAIQSTAIQLLQLLDKRFFGTVGPLHSEGEKGMYLNRFYVKFK